MEINKNNHINKFLIFSIVFVMLTTFYTQFHYLTNDNINIIAGKETIVNLNVFTSNVKLVQKERAISVNGNLSTEYSVDTSKSLTFFSNNEGHYSLTANILGIIPIKEVTVNVLPDIKIYPGGQIIGVKLNTLGVIAVGFEDIADINGVLCSPAKNAKIMEGDIIRKINDIEVNTASKFRELLNSLSGEKIILTIIRKDVTLNIEITPIQAQVDGKYKIGLWVRDNVAGIGTLTCIADNKKSFAALGHGITDSTTGITVPLNNGELVAADIINLVKGKKNVPGEIRGLFTNTDKTYGMITTNDDFGIFGIYNGDLDLYYPEPLPIATQNEIQLGPAKIITTLDNGIKEYDITIDRINKQKDPDTKSMVITVTDKELLEKTGGIIQGMSGSPIIQNGKIIGAVTHVLVSDPTKGYAIFIEWMIEDLYNCQN